MKKLILCLFALAVFSSCASWRPRKLIKWGLLAGGGGLVAGSVVMAGGNVAAVPANEPSRACLTLGGVFLVFSAVAFCLDVDLKPNEILGGF